NHRGSSYGSLGLPPQPTNEQFENLITLEWLGFDPQRPVWVEAESRRVGICRVPDEIFGLMSHSPVIQVERSRSQRIKILLEVYGSANPDALIAATERISKKLGGQNAKAAIVHIQQGDLSPAIELVLDYYDQTYLFDLQRRNVQIHPVILTELSLAESVDLLIQKSRQLLGDFSISSSPVQSPGEEG
ncbi:MAG: tRNA 2-selenouridine(34) synthase MnmH, partial [Leptolyngbyaceae cyanobacterium SU_3_3]|nr:tRNA 2-selenouridine(34) synthase MnmH [Leptolyngbyaceae cyanobacterium SU_3_3]